MNLDDDTCYRALAARDTRFDGVFFVGVRSTGIYCRPVCTAKTPGRTRCRFFPNAPLAERAGFRPCLRCRPELAPGHAPVDSVRTAARAAAARIEAGALNDGGRLDDLAASLSLSARQLRRSLRQELGLSPIELAQTNRLLLAKRLIADTNLPMTQVAYAAGFASVRRFNALFRRHYRLAPSDLRRAAPGSADGDRLRLTLSYRPPFDWDHLLYFLGIHAIPGVESVVGDTYSRTVAAGDHRGWLSVAPLSGRSALVVDLSADLAPVLPALLSRLRHLFDLDARPDVIDSHLALDPRFAPWVARRPGLRVPGAFDTFEIGLRTILGQLVSVRGGTTLSGRFAKHFGEPIDTPIPGLTHLTPTAARIAEADKATIAGLGLPGTRAEAIRKFAGAVANGELSLEPGADPDDTMARLVALPGIGPWTAQSMAMRALHWPDAFPVGDLALAKATGLKSAKQLIAASEQWRPWRAYAAMHLWESLNLPVEPTTPAAGV